MSFIIPDDVILETTKCRHDFSCIETKRCGNADMCEVWYANGKNVLFLNTEEPATCSYRLPFAYSQICTCPTHFAIYEKYGRQNLTHTQCPFQDFINDIKQIYIIMACIAFNFSTSFSDS